jgi:hypothetical protein
VDSTADCLMGDIFLDLCPAKDYLGSSHPLPPGMENS